MSRKYFLLGRLSRTLLADEGAPKKHTTIEHFETQLTYDDDPIDRRLR